MIGNILSDEWVVSGHSEGGMTAWRTNERLAMKDQEELLKAGKFLGAVAAAPALRPTELIPKSIRLAKDGPLGAPVYIYMVQTLVEIYPQLKIEDILTKESMELLPLLDQACLITGDALFHNMSVTDVFRSTAWLESKEFREWQTKINGAGPHKLAAPMMVVQGLGDTLTYPEECEQDFDRTCDAFPDSRAELYLVPELDHDPSFSAAQPYYLAYIESLFEDRQFKKGCKKVTAVPTNDRYSRVNKGP
jgi:pimeloyl-ACP methyl ester carboxylesterase